MNWESMKPVKLENRGFTGFSFISHSSATVLLQHSTVTEAKAT